MANNTEDDNPHTLRYGQGTNPPQETVFGTSYKKPVSHIPAPLPDWTQEALEAARSPKKTQRS